MEFRRNQSLALSYIPKLSNDLAKNNFAHLFADNTTMVTKRKNINLQLEEANNSLEMA
jgi:hypothetical protein